MTVGRSALDLSPASSPRIALIGTDAIWRRRAAACLGDDGLAVAGRFSSVDSFAADHEVGADVVVLSCGRFSADEVETVRRLGRTSPGLPVVAVAKAIARSHLADALSAGLGGCVLERDIESCLGLAVVAAHRGQASVPREFAAVASSRPYLSVREKQILALVVMGLSNAEIATKLFVSESTVKSHLSSAFGRLGVRSRHEAAAVILDPDSGLGTGILAISGDERRRGRA